MHLRYSLLFTFILLYVQFLLNFLGGIDEYHHTYFWVMTLILVFENGFLGRFDLISQNNWCGCCWFQIPIMIAHLNRLCWFRDLSNREDPIIGVIVWFPKASRLLNFLISILYFMSLCIVVMRIGEAFHMCIVYIIKY